MVRYLLVTFALLLFLPRLVSATDSAVTVSPAYLDYSVKPAAIKEFKLSITNNEAVPLSLDLLAVRLYKTEDGFRFVENKDLLTIPTSTAQLLPGQKLDFSIIAKIGEEILSADYTPGVVAQFKQTGSGVVGVNRNLIVPVRVTFTPQIRQNMNVGITTIPAQIVLNQQFDVLGSVTNNQNRYVQPGASIQLREGTKFLGEWSVTEIFPEKLEPFYPLAFQYRVQGVNLTPLHTYQVYFSVTDSITKQAVVTSYSFIYVPLGIALLIVVVALMLIAGLVMTVIYRRRKRDFKVYRRL